MGYEITLIIGETISGLKAGSQDLLEVARIDLCKTDFKGTKLEVPGFTNERISVYNGDDRVNEDCYGDKLFTNSPKAVLEFIKKHNKGTNKYRRYTAAIALLECLIKDFGDNLTCVLYGH